MALGVFRVYPGTVSDYEINYELAINCEENIPKDQEKLYTLIKQTSDTILALHDFKKDMETNEGKKDTKNKKEPDTSEEFLEDENSEEIDKDEPESQNEDGQKQYSMEEIMERNAVKGHNKIKKKYMNRLLNIAQVGLVGTNAQPKLAIKSVQMLKEEILLHEGGKIKNRNLVNLGLCALWLGALFFLTGYFLRLVSNGAILAGTFFSDTIGTMSISPYFIVFAGAVIGAWIGYGVEKKNLKFKDLAIVHQDRLKSLPRLILFGLSGAILLLFLNSGIIELDFGNISNNLLMSSIKYQLLLGVFAGILGNKLTSGLVEKAVDIFDAKEEEGENTQSGNS
jgi:hypothetical protein